MFLGMDHHIFLTESGKAYSCGRNDFFQLNDGTNTNRKLFVEIAESGPGVTAFALSYEATYMIKNEVLYSIGRNNVFFQILFDQVLE